MDGGQTEYLHVNTPPESESSGSPTHSSADSEESHSEPPTSPQDVLAMEVDVTKVKLEESTLEKLAYGMLDRSRMGLCMVMLVLFVVNPFGIVLDGARQGKLSFGTNEYDRTVYTGRNIQGEKEGLC